MLHPSGRKWKVYMSLPSNGTVVDFQGYALREIQDLYKDEVELVFPEMLCQRIFHDASRNGIVEDFLDSGCDIMWTLDSDIVPPKFALDLVTTHGNKWQVAGCPYPVFMATPGESHRQVVFTTYKRIADCPKTKKPRVAPSEVPREGTEFVDGIATGCLFIKREVFDKLERPYFEFKYDPITRQPIEGEDIGFILKMVRLGIPFFIDYSMTCKHYKNNIDLLEMSNYAMIFGQKCVNNYSRNVAEMVQKVEEKYIKMKDERDKLRDALKQAQSIVQEAQRIQAQASKRDPGKPLIFR